MISRIKEKRIFITGGAGFIGSHFVDIFIKENKKVTVFDNLSSGKKDFLINSLKNNNLHLISGDLLKKEQVEKSLDQNTDIVIHLAANPDISRGIEDPSLDFNQTIVATFLLLQTMKEKKIKKLVYFSGSGVYGDIGTTYSSENYGPLLPVSMYGASKLSAEGIISAFSHLFGIQSWIFRPANIVGDRATHGVVFDFINKLRKNPSQLKILGDGNQSKSYLYVSDIIEAVFLAMQKTNEEINIFNIASTSFITVNEIAELVIIGMGLKNVHIIHTEGKIGWPGDVPIVRINNKKLNDLGWKPRFSSRQAVQQTIKDLLNK